MGMLPWNHPWMMCPWGPDWGLMRFCLAHHPLGHVGFTCQAEHLLIPGIIQVWPDVRWQKAPKAWFVQSFAFFRSGWNGYKNRPDILKVWWTKVSANINIICRIYSSWIPNSSGHQYDVCFLIEGNLHRFLTKSCVVVPRLRWAN